METDNARLKVGLGGSIMCGLVRIFFFSGVLATNQRLGLSRLSAAA